MSSSIYPRTHAALMAASLLAVAALLVGADPAITAAACDSVWRMRSVPASQPLRDVAVTGPHRVWVVGDGGFAAHSVAGSWQADPLPPGVQANRVAAVEGFKWALGQTDPRTYVVLRWRAGGWHLVKTFATGTVRLRSIAVNRDHQVWVAGEIVAADESTRPLVVWFDGKDWNQRVLAAGGRAGGVDTAGDSSTIVAGIVTGLGNVTWRWDGATWKRQRLFSQDVEDFYAPLAVVVALARQSGRAYAASIYDEGDCCHTDILASRFVSGAWETPVSEFGSPFDIVASRDGRTATIVGDDFFGDGGGGYYAGVIYGWNGDQWSEEFIDGLPKRSGSTWYAHGLDDDSSGSRWLAGATPGGGPLLARQCAPARAS